MSSAGQSDVIADVFADVVNQLRAENFALRTQLENLLEQAHRNQNIMSRHQSFDLKLIGASSFRELIENIFSALAKMSELDIVTLGLLDYQKICSRSCWI